jgi:hypothetical protein
MESLVGLTEDPPEAVAERRVMPPVTECSGATGEVRRRAKGATLFVAVKIWIKRTLCIPKGHRAGKRNHRTARRAGASAGCRLQP